MPGPLQHEGMDELRAALRADAAAIGEALLGPPNKAASSRATLRWGSKGSLALEVHGPKAGLWFSHEGDDGSDILGLIRHAQQCSFSDAVRWARNWTGVAAEAAAAAADNPDAVRRAQQERDRRARQAEMAARETSEAADRDASRIRAARAIAGGCVPLAGSVAEYYLKQVRGIPPGPNGWPAAVRFHPGHRALVVVATTTDGAVQAVQRVHLDEGGGKVGKAEMEARHLQGVKITNGVLDGAAVRLPGASDGPLLLCEGPETGLAAWGATGHETWIALGAIAKLTPPADRLIGICRDDDPRYSPADRKVASTIDGWRKAGRRVAVVTPWATRRWDRSDLANAILAEGIEAVQLRVAAALDPVGKAVNNDARNALLDSLRGTPTDIDAAEAARDATAVPAITSPLTGATAPADTQPVVDTIDKILAGPAGQRDAVVKALSNVRDKLTSDPTGLQTDPAQLYGIRKAIGDTLSPLAANAGSDAQLASRELLDVKASLDNAIEGAAPGFKQGLADYADASKPIDAMRYLQSKGFTAADGTVTLAKVKAVLDDIAKQQALPGPRAAKSVAPDTVTSLQGLYADLLRQNNSRLGMQAGSNTYQNLATDSALAGLGTPLAWTAKGLNRIPGGNLLTGGIAAAYRGQNDAVQHALINRLLNPGLATNALTSAPYVPLSGANPFITAPLTIGGNRLTGPR